MIRKGGDSNVREAFGGEFVGLFIHLSIHWFIVKSINALSTCTFAFRVNFKPSEQRWNELVNEWKTW